MDTKEKITEQPSRFDHLEEMSVSELLQHINEEDYRVAESVRQALPQIEALVEAIGSEGLVIRFAGDEFIILIPVFKPVTIDDYKDRIHRKLDEYNESSGKPYKLSAAIGGRIFDPHTENTSGIVNEIDSMMYKDKSDYYREHDRRGRR